ncbi:MAG: porin family protein [Alphaproteobacteria bacterium]|nr:porin family protein [Alphaproteobacteria bacterium]
MKKLSLLAGTAAIAMFLYAAPASAQSETAHTDNGSGIYLGGYGGYGWTDAETAGADGNLNGGDYGVFAGIELTNWLNQYQDWGMTAAIEAHYGWSGADDDTGALSFDKQDEWGVSFRPGFVALDDAMPLGLKPYGIIGYRHLDIDTTTLGDQDFNGLELGLGTEVMAYGDLGLRLDYTHVFYGADGGIDPDEDNLRLGVGYHF